VSHPLISHSTDLRRLRDDGYAIEIRSAYLVVDDIPYVNARREVRSGRIVAKLNLAGDVTGRPDTHQVQFAGETPCHADGSPMTEILSSSATTKLGEQLVIDHSFSQKPLRGHYVDYYEQIVTYATILSNPARSLDPAATARTYRVEEPDEDEGLPFNYLDTASSRANINLVRRKLELGPHAIVGLGGTGAYVLDFVAKTPVREIHVFDGKKFSTHNAFRSPGAASIEELREQPLKTTYFTERYGKARKGIVAHHTFVDASNVDQLRGMDFVFLCIDRPAAKRAIVAKLREWGIPFVDVGMGLYVKNDAIGGIVRVTASTSQKTDHVERRVSFSATDEDNDYDTNIQTVELNALNAALAVMRWKKHFGFYADFEKEYFTAYSIESNLLASDDYE